MGAPLTIKPGAIVQFQGEYFRVLSLQGFKVWLADAGDFVSNQPLPWLTPTAFTALPVLPMA